MSQARRRKRRQRKPSFGGVRGVWKTERRPAPKETSFRQLAAGGVFQIARPRTLGFDGITGLIIPVEFELRIEEGLEELSDNAINQMQEEARAIIEQAGRDMENTAKGLVPVRTGRLRESIFHEVLDIEGLAVGSTVEYAAYVEYGTSRMQAQPFIEPAIVEHQPMLEEALDQMILEQVDRDLAFREEMLAERGEDEWFELETEASPE